MSLGSFISSLPNLFKTDMSDSSVHSSSNLDQLKLPGADYCSLAVADAADSPSIALEESGQHFRQRLILKVEEIAIEAMEFGARELYIGHPSEGRYEFFVEESGYQGAIDPAEFRALLELFVEQDEIVIPVDWPEVHQLEFSLTNNFANPVIHVCWRYRWLDNSLLELPYPQ